MKNCFNTRTDDMMTLNKDYIHLNFNPIKTVLERFNFFF